MSNKALWERVCVTDPAAVKPITGKQYNGNSPKPYWIVERLTDEFGPCGIGWGFQIINERFERFSDTDSLHVAVVRLWYVQDGKRGELEQIGQTKASYVTSKGSFALDEDAPKKSVTDALVKCASYLGFAGDIFSGRWDDSKYVAEARAEWEGRKREADPQRRAWLDARKAEIAGAKTSGELKKIMTAAIDMVRSQGDQAAEDELSEAYAAKVATAKKPEPSDAAPTA